MITDVDLISLEYICLNMRKTDADEVFGMLPHDNPCRLAWESYYMITNQGRGKIAWHNGKPAAIAAFTEHWPGVWWVWMFGTDNFRDAAIPLLRWFRKEANEILSVCNGHRLQCDSMMGHEEAHKMIQAFGGVPEGPPMRRYGKHGADYQRFIWLNGENDAVLKDGYIRAA